MAFSYTVYTVQHPGGEPVEVSLEISLSVDGVDLSFPDGRQVRMSADEWVAVGVLAIRDAATWKDLVAFNFRRTLVVELSHKLLEATQSLYDNLSKIIEAK